MKYNLNKKGESAITMPLILIISVIFIVVIGVYIINCIIPFLWYEKLNSISQKYMFVIEKYGYLTVEEKENLVKDLNNRGFNTENIQIDAPNNIKEYGELLEFSIRYKLVIKTPTISNNILNSKEKQIYITVKKNSFCKR
ncbi:MAG: hypothetical protein RSE00_02015 [Clostridia bacterium]